VSTDGTVDSTFALPMPPGVNFTNILWAPFFVQKCFAKLFSNYSMAWHFFDEMIFAQKLLVKCWCNWLQKGETPGHPQGGYPTQGLAAGSPDPGDIGPWWTESDQQNWSYARTIGYFTLQGNFYFLSFKNTGLNFTNVLRTAFARPDPKSVKRCWRLNCIIYTFGIYKC